MGVAHSDHHVLIVYTDLPSWVTTERARNIHSPGGYRYTHIGRAKAPLEPEVLPPLSRGVYLINTRERWSPEKKRGLLEKVFLEFNMGSLESLREEAEVFPACFDAFVAGLKDEGDATRRVHEMRILEGGIVYGDYKDKLAYLRVDVLASPGSVKKVKQLLEKMFEVGAEQKVAGVCMFHEFIRRK